MGMGLGNLLDRSREAIAAAAEAAGVSVNGPGFMDFDNGHTTDVTKEGFDLVDAAGNVFSGAHFDLGQLADVDPESRLAGVARGLGAFGLRVQDARKMLLWLAILAVVMFIGKSQA